MGFFFAREELYGSKAMRFFLMMETPYGPSVIGSCIVVASRNPMAIGHFTWSCMVLGS